MSDQDVAALLRDLADPERPDDQFADALFATLFSEVDFEHGRPRRAARPMRLRWFPAHASSGLWIALLVLLLLAALVGSAIIGRQPVVVPGPIPSTLRAQDGPLIHSPLADGDPTVRSQQVFRNPPPFDVTVESAGVSIRFQFDGHGLLRGTRSGSGNFYPLFGSAFVFDGRTFFRYADDGTYAGAVNGVSATGRPLGGVLGQSQPGDALGRTSPLAAYPLAWPFDGVDDHVSIPACEGEVSRGVETVAGRAADHVSCSSARFSGDYWVDRETGLLLEVAPLASPPIVATDFHVGVAPDPTLFARPTGPSGEPPLQRGAMPAGTYATVRFWVPMLVTVPDGWSDGIEAGRSGQIAGPDEEFVSWGVPILYDPASQHEIGIPGRTPRKVVDWLDQRVPGLIGVASPATVAGHGGVEFDVHLNRGDACDTRLRAGCPLQAQEPDRWVAHGFVVQAKGHLVLFVLRAATVGGMTAARQEIERFQFQ